MRKFGFKQFFSCEEKMSENKRQLAVAKARQSWKYICSNVLTVLTVAGICFGLSFGLLLRNCRQDKWSEREQVYVKFGGEIFLRMLRALSLPLILSSVIAALGSLDLRLSGKVGLRTFLFYLLTTICAVFLGILLVIAIQPGAHDKHEKLQQPSSDPLNTRKVFNGDVMMDMIRNMFPSNIVQATLSQYQTIMDMPTMDQIQEQLHKNKTGKLAASYPTKSRYVDGTNMLGLVIYASVFGIALASMGTYGKPLLKIVRCLSQLTMVISTWVLWLAPVGIFCLLAGQILEVKNFEGALDRSTGLYILTVLLGLLLHGLIVLPGVYFLIVGSHPFKLIVKSVQALVTAFGTSSSIATLPASVSCVEDNHGVDPRVSRFVLPVGAAMNMDGTALYQAVSAFFIVQLHGIPMDFGSIVAVSFIATVSSIGASGIPHAGIVIMTMMMNTLGLPAHNIAFLIPIDWILHRFRTTINVLGDILAANLVGELSKDELDKFPATRVISKELTTSVEHV